MRRQLAALFASIHHCPTLTTAWSVHWQVHNLPPSSLPPEMMRFVAVVAVAFLLCAGGAGAARRMRDSEPQGGEPVSLRSSDFSPNFNQGTYNSPFHRLSAVSQWTHAKPMGPPLTPPDMWGCNETLGTLCDSARLEGEFACQIFIGKANKILQNYGGCDDSYKQSFCMNHTCVPTLVGQCGSARNFTGAGTYKCATCLGERSKQISSSCTDEDMQKFCKPDVAFNQSEDQYCTWQDGGHFCSLYTVNGYQDYQQNGEIGACCAADEQCVVSPRATTRATCCSENEIPACRIDGKLQPAARSVPAHFRNDHQIGFFSCPDARQPSCMCKNSTCDYDGAPVCFDSGHEYCCIPGNDCANSVCILNETCCTGMWGCLFDYDYKDVVEWKY
eukprot:SAG11_NODE_172_length_13574_cov_14.732690_8_plen_388_part_00